MSTLEIELEEVIQETETELQLKKEFQHWIKNEWNKITGGKEILSILLTYEDEGDEGIEIVTLNSADMEIGAILEHIWWMDILEKVKGIISFKDGDFVTRTEENWI